MTVFEQLRRRSSVWAVVVLPLLAVASLRAPASMCAEMLAEAAVEVGSVGSLHADSADGHAPSSGREDTGGETVHFGGRHGHRAAHAEHAGHGGDTGHSEHGGHADADATGQRGGDISPDPGMPGHDHASCPHCPAAPLSDGGSAGHVVCDTTQSVVDQRAPPAAQWDAKHAFPLACRVAPPVAAPPDGPFVATARDRPPAPLVPLNIRYCVYLI